MCVRNILIGKPALIRSHIKAVCDAVTVTFKVYVSSILHYQWITSYIWFQEQIEEEIKIDIHGASNGDLKHISFLNNHEFVIYTLTANKIFSIFFEVFTAAGAVNVSHDNFSKKSHLMVRTMQCNFLHSNL